MIFTSVDPLTPNIFLRAFKLLRVYGLLLVILGWLNGMVEMKEYHFPSVLLRIESKHLLRAYFVKNLLSEARIIYLNLIEVSSFYLK